MEFFERITSEYRDCPNLIFEICNEPNGPADWSDVISFSNQVIPVIRKNIPDSVIVVGTPEYDKNLAGAILRPLEFDNVTYVLHFYAASHKEGLRGELSAAIDAGLPVDLRLVVTGDWDIDRSCERMTKLLQLDPRPDGVFCFYP